MGKEISQTTIKNYLARGKCIVEEAGGKLSKDWPTISQVTGRLLARREELCKPSWRHYRAALLYYFQDQLDRMEGGPGPELAAEFDQARDALNTADLSVCPKASQTSSKRTKAVSKAQLNALVKALSSPGAKLSRQDIRRKTLYLFLSGLGTGARPSEWPSGRIEANTPHPDLVVQTKKQRGKVVERRIPLVNQHMEEVVRENLAMLNLWMSVTGATDPYEYIDKCRKHLRRTVIDTLGKDVHVTLYDARHQFASNIKAVGASQERVAELLGHAKTKNTSMYGRKSKGWGKPVNGKKQNHGETQYEGAHAPSMATKGGDAA